MRAMPRKAVVQPEGILHAVLDHIGEMAETIDEQDKEIPRLRTGEARANLFLEDCDPAEAVLMLREAFDSEALARIIELLREGAAGSGNADG